ncbi:MAG: hypothetical protein QOH88_3508 [Verrucomicrobiota bacterium]|jgi:hypothetical protein
MKLLPHVLALALMGYSNSSLSAATVSYPETNPAVTMELPKGWTVARQAGDVLIITPDVKNALIMVRRAEVMKDERGVKAELLATAEEAKRMFSLHDVQVGGAPEEKEIGELKSLWNMCTAKDDKEQPAHLQVIIMAPREHEFFVITVLYNDEHQLETIADRTAILMSLKPVAGSK